MAESKDIDAQINRMYIELNTLNSIAESLKQQSDTIEKYILDTQLSLNTINEISNSDSGHKILLPLGSVLLIDAVLTNNRSAYLHVGANIIIKKSNTEIKAFLETQLTQLQKEQIETQKKLNQVMNNISVLQVQLNSLLQNVQR